MTGRVLTGETTRIVIPLDGIDPDGDSVTLVGLDRTPAKGTARVGAAAIEYTAATGSLGTDVFSYVVEDRLGARATGTVSVGIAPTPEANHPPVAVDDQISVRPGRKVAVDVLANDTDADGDAIRFSGAPGTDSEVPVNLVEGRVTLTAPEKPGVVVVRYPITDGRGGTDTGNLAVDVRPDARLLPPLARDDRVAVTETVGRTQVEVPILENDEDPDGVVSELKIALPERTDGVSVTSGRDLLVTLTDEAQVIPYTLTDIDGQKSTAFVLVPGSMEERPSLRSTAPLEVTSGERLILDLEKLVKVRSGRTPRITQDEKVRGVSGTASVIDAARLAYISEQGFTGAASVSFEVTDGSGPDDPKGLKATLTVGINVKPKRDENRPPVFRSNTLETAQGEEAATLDLRQAASDPDPEDADKLRFALTGGSLDGVKVTLAGSVLTAQANADTRSGSRGVFDVTVTDGRSAPVQSTVTVTVISTKRPLPVANDDTVVEAHSGRAEAVKVLANDTNPFPDTPLRLMTAQVRVGQGTASVSGDTVTVTPADDFVGTMEVRYRIQDKTRDPGREVDGRIRLTVKGRPDAPVTPVIQEVRDRTVVLSWEPPANNGSPITGYTVSGTGGFSQACPAATCTLTGLTNNKEYTFSVVARNAVGTSEPSPESAVARPDVKPDAPLAPQLVFGDASLTVSWTKPASKGSPVKAYNLEISPPPSSGVARKDGITTSPYTWTGLTNGVAYQVRVQAVNDATEPSDWSAYSAAEVPAGVPDAPLAPTAVRNESAANGGVIDVSWTPPNSNGAAVQGYDLHVFRNGVAEPTRANLPPSPTGAQLTGLDTSSNYTFAVVARNKAGASEPSAQSAAVTPYGQPLTPQKPRALATGNNYQISLLFDEPGNNGSPITGYQVSIDGGGWSNFGGPGANVKVANNGAPGHTFQVRALNAAGAGPASPVSNKETAYGPIANAANIGKSSDGIHASFTWNPREADYANGRPVTSMTVAVNGNRVPNNGSWSGGNSPDTTFTLRIEVCRADGCRTFSQSVQTASRQAEMSQGPKKVGGDCFTNECWHFGITLRNFMPSRNVSIDCFYTKLDGTAHRFAGFTTTTDGNGYSYTGDRCYLGHKNSINSANKWTGPYWFRATEGGTGRVVDSNKNVSW